MEMIFEKLLSSDLYIKVYDPITKTLITTYDNYKEASKKLGIPYKIIQRACMSKTRRFSPILNKEVAIRLSNKNK